MAQWYRKLRDGQYVSIDDPSLPKYTDNQSICCNADEFIIASVSHEFEFEIIVNDICLQRSVRTLFNIFVSALTHHPLMFLFTDIPIK